MLQQIVTFLINLLIATTVILFSISLSYILNIMIFQLKVTSGEINSALITMFVSGVIASLSISIKPMFNKGKNEHGYIFVGKVIAVLVVGMLIARYFMQVN